MLGHILGVPDEHLDQLIELGDRMLVDTDPELRAPSPARRRSRVPAVRLRSPGAELLRARPRAYERAPARIRCDDVLSLLANAELERLPVSQRDLDNNFAMLVVAGNETTRQAMASGTLAPVEHPDQWQLLRADPSLMPTAIDELIRYASPGLALPPHGDCRHRAARRADPQGRQASSSGSPPPTATPRRSPIPHRLDLTRSATCTPPFGRGGPHFCLGAHLARLEMAVLFEQLLPRIESIELAGPPARLRSNFTNGLKRLPVRVVEKKPA